jgi:hypothetical protein
MERPVHRGRLCDCVGYREELYAVVVLQLVQPLILRGYGVMCICERGSGSKARSWQGRMHYNETVEQASAGERMKDEVTHSVTRESR